MKTFWISCLKQPQTPLVLLGTALGLGLLITHSGNRPLAWFGGGAVATVMVSSWISGSHSSRSTVDEMSDLLNPAIFRCRIEAIQVKIARTHQAAWKPVRYWALQSQACAVHICDRDPWLQTELLEALHTVVDLAQKVADGLQVKVQIQTPLYQYKIQKQLRQHCDRLQKIYAQLQQFQDHLALTSLETTPADITLPQRLQALIHTNQSP
ncbi:MAG: hypothetical protein F6J95_031540 [Leptolyngbya sp. SIO1E4]|nr:hypothetical protein [Leptolyngbya sp. SIO1E4]